jgi:AhpD family alkylhydroperoxidase
LTADAATIGACGAYSLKWTNDRLLKERMMEQQLYPNVSKDLAQQRKDLAPEIYAAFRSFGQRVFADGALPSKTKQLIAIAVAHATQCPYCIRGHTELAVQKGANDEEIMEAIWVATEMLAGAAYAHSMLAIDAMNQSRSKREG